MVVMASFTPAVAPLSVMVVGWAAREFYLTKMDNTRLTAMNRSLNYELMQVSIRWQVDHDRMVDLLSKQRAKRLAASAEAAKEIADLKQGVEDALELLAIYRTIGINPENTPLPGLRDRLSAFGRLVEAGPTEPADLSERSEWSGFK